MPLWTHVELVFLSFDCLSQSLHPIVSPPLSALIFFSLHPRSHGQAGHRRKRVTEDFPCCPPSGGFPCGHGWGTLPVALGETFAASFARLHGYSDSIWWINRPVLTKPTSGEFLVMRQSRQAFSSQSEPHSELFCGYLHPFPHNMRQLPSGFEASQAESGGKEQESTSRAVHRRLVLPAAIAGVRCR